jgi:hypothetical protein
MAKPNGRGGWELTDEDVAEIARASGWDDGHRHEPAATTSGKWTVTVDGGPAFMANAATACRIAAVRVAAGPGGIRDTFLRLAAAFEDAAYEPGDTDGEEVSNG